MNIVNELTKQHLEYWADQNPRSARFAAPADMPNCVDCSAIVTTSNDGQEQQVVRVAQKPSDDDVMQLLAGGTIWVSTWGGLPPHMLEVQAMSS